MKIIDISWPLSPEMTGYKDRQELSVFFTRKFEEDQVRQSKIIIECHAGTHVDAPSHMLEFGENIEKIKLESLVGQCFVLDFSHVTSVITKQDINFNIQKNIILKDMILLLKTKNSELDSCSKFDKNFVYLNSEAAQYCVELGIKTIGIDYLGIERDQPLHETHKILLSNNITLIEGLRLKSINPGSYFLICLPLKLEGLEAAPARAILIANF